MERTWGWTTTSRDVDKFLSTLKIPSNMQASGPHVIFLSKWACWNPTIFCSLALRPKNAYQDTLEVAMPSTRGKKFPVCEAQTVLTTINSSPSLLSAYSLGSDVLCLQNTLKSVCCTTWVSSHNRRVKQTANWNTPTCTTETCVSACPIGSIFPLLVTERQWAIELY